MIKKIALAGLFLCSANSFAAVETQAELIKKADEAAAKNNMKVACANYEKVYDLGYKGGDPLNQTQNKTFLNAALRAAECVEKNNAADPADYQAVGMYHDLKGNFDSKEAHDRLVTIQQNKLKEASTVLKSHATNDFAKPNAATDQACQSAEFGYLIGYLGEEKNKKVQDNLNMAYVSNGIYHATCISLNPNLFISGSQQTSTAVAYGILKDLATNYGSSFAAALITPDQ